MSVTAVVLLAASGGFVPPAEVVTYFPGSFFHDRVREPLHRQVMASWPGPAELLRLWREAELSEGERVALLIGGAAFHDPTMLPAYREALVSKSQRLRQAAIYGYRDCIGDGLPNVNVSIDEDIVAIHADEMRWMERTMGRTSLVAMWLQSALIQEGASLPGYNGIRLTRSPSDCLRAVARLADVHDLDLLVNAYELTSKVEIRISILMTVEGLTMSRFIIMPEGERVGWGPHVYESALRSLEASIRSWRRNGCVVDGETVLVDNLRSFGWEIADPLGAESCRLWIEIVRGERQQWWPMAARRLYACGGPRYEISALDLGLRQRHLRNQLVEWYKVRRAPTGGRR